jgi:hypothetical protein
MSKREIWGSESNPTYIMRCSHSHRIRWLTGEPRIGSRVPIRGTFAYRFSQIREEIRGNKRTTSTRKNSRVGEP